MSDKDITVNPLLQPFHTLHGTFPFTDIATEHIREAIMKGMEQEREEVNSICTNAEAPSFSNTIKALEASGKLLERATTLMYNLTSAATSDELDDLANEMAPLLADHSNDIMQNGPLFEKVKSVMQNPPQDLTEEDAMLLERTFDSFVRSGANLPQTSKQKFRENSKRISQLTLKFSQNLLKETNDFQLCITDESQLSGLPTINKEAAAAEAKERGVSGWVFTLHAPSYRPLMMYADNRELRHDIYLAYNTLCTHENEYNNFGIVKELVNLRREQAQLLGYKNYAQLTLKRRMAQNPENVMNLLHALIEQYLQPAKQEVKRIEQFAKQMEGEAFQLEPWDFSYYAQKLNKQVNDYDPNELRPYFELSQVKKGVLGLATRLYGITFKRNTSIPVFHQDVEAYEVFDKNGEYLAVIYFDFFPRSNKQSGAWMTSYQEEACHASSHVDATPQNTQRPHVSVTTNFTKPNGDTPSLLTLYEVETFLHEFGHALHGIFAMTHYASLSGTSVYWDFVELPPQFMENYAIEPEFLSTFAKHYQTGEPLPASYIEKIQRSRRFNVAYACIRQVSFGLLDMAYYTLEAPFTANVLDFEHKAWQETIMLPHLSNTCMTTQFSHIMSGGYAAGYYSYKWAEVLDADAFSVFQEEGVFNSHTAQRFRDCILSKGGTSHPMKLYKNFRKQEPSIQALLRRDGITQSQPER